MMSDHAAQRYKQGEGLGLVFSGANVDASQHPYTGQWMAHWMQACKSSSPEGSQLHNAAVVGDVVDHFKGCDSLAVERVKSKEFKLSSMDMNQRYDCGCNGKSSSAVGNVDLIPYAIQSGKTVDDHWGASRMRRNVEFFYDETTISREVTAHQLTESSIKWKNTAYDFQDLDAFSLEFEHFPMFDINRKLETIMASTKKSSYGAMSVKMMNGKLPLCESPVTSSPVELAPGSRLGAKNKIGGTEKVMEHYGGLQSDEAEISFLAIHGCKCQNTNRAACISSHGLPYKDPTNAKLTCMQHKPCCSSFSYKFIESGAKKNPESISRHLRCSRTSLKDGSTHVLRESTPNDLPHPFSTEEHNTEVKVDSSYRLLLGQKRLNKPVSSHIYNSPTKMPKCSMHDVSQHGSCRLKSVESGEGGFHKFSSTIKCLLVADEMHLEQCHRELTMGDSTFEFTQVEGTAFSETIALPTEQNYAEKEGEFFENFTCDLERTGGGGIAAHLIEPHNESSVKTDTKYPNAFHRSSSLPGETFPRRQKGVTYPNLRKSETSLASLSQQAISRNIEAGMTDVRVEHSASTDRATRASNKEGVASRTESMAEDHDVLHAKITDVSSSLPNYTMLTEACSRWVKRLQHKNSGNLSAKRFKKGDASSIEVMQMFSRIKNYNSLNYDVHWCMKEQHKFDKTMKLSKIVKPSSSDSEEAVQSWIRRWCHYHHQVSMTASRPEKFEDKSFASIGAMSLMGKAMNNYRPCSFRRKEASLVWNT